MSALWRVSFRTLREAAMDLKDRRLWYAVAAVIVAIVVLGYALGWFTGTPNPAPSPQQ